MRTSAKALAATASIAMFFTAGIAEAQQLTHGYGQDVTPGSNSSFANWGAYGVDHVPESAVFHPGHYVMAYGVDQVPGTPGTNRLREATPGRVDEVLTGATQPATSPSANTTRPRRRWRIR